MSPTIRLDPAPPCRSAFAPWFGAGVALATMLDSAGVMPLGAGIAVASAVAVVLSLLAGCRRSQVARR